MQLTPDIQKAIDSAVTRAVARIARSETYFTAKECGAVMRLHEDTVLRYIRAGKLRCVGSGRHLRIPHSAVVDFFAARPEPAAKAPVHG